MPVVAVVPILILGLIQSSPTLDSVPNPMQFQNPYSRQTKALNSGLSRTESTLVEQLLNVSAPEFGTGAKANAFGIDTLSLRKLCLLMTREVIKPEYTMPDANLASEIEKKITSGVNSLLAKYKIDSESVLGERLRAQGYADWTRTHVAYDQTYFTKWDETRKHQGDQSKFVLGWQPRAAVCGGIQVTFRDLARSAGIKCTMITCQTRSPGHKNSPNANHTIVIATFKNGLTLPVDCSSCTVSLDDAVAMQGAIHSFWVLPITPAELSIFVAYRHQHNENETSFGDKQNVFRFTTAGLEEWRNWNVNALDRFEPKPLLSSGFYWGK